MAKYWVNGAPTDLIDSTSTVPDSPSWINGAPTGLLTIGAPTIVEISRVGIKYFAPELNEKNFTANSLTTGAVGFPTVPLFQIHPFAANDLTTAIPTIPNASMGQKHAVTATAFVPDVVEFGPLGTELTTNGALTADVSWQKNSDVVIANGYALLTKSAIPEPSIQQNIAYTTGRNYVISLETEMLSAANSGVIYIGMPYPHSFPGHYNVGFRTSRSYFTVVSETFVRVGLGGGVAATGVGRIHSISVKEITGAALAQKHVLTATALATTSPIFEALALAQKHALTVNSLTAAAPIIPTTAIGQVHKPTANDLNTTFALLPSPAFVQVIGFTANALSTVSPFIDSPGFAAAGHLFASALNTASPAFNNQPITQIHGIAAQDLNTSAPFFTTSAFTEGVGIFPNDLHISPVAFDTVALYQKHVITSNNFTPSIPAFTSPAITQKHVLNPSGKTTASPAFNAATFTQKQILVGNNLVPSNIILPNANFSERNALTANSISTAVPFLHSPNFSGFENYEVPASADISVGAWRRHDNLTTDLYSTINESTPDDTDFIRSPNLNEGTSAITMALTASPTPTVDYGHIIKVRMRSPYNQMMTATARLLEGNTVIAEWRQENVPNDWVTYTNVLTEAQAASINDYGNLRIQIEAEAP